MATVALTKVVAFVRRLSDVEGSLSDRQLLDRFVGARDEGAFAELVRRHGPMVLAACRRVLRHEQDAEDAFQASFLVLARKAGSVRQGDSVGGWLYRVAYRLALRARAVGCRRREQLTPAGEEVTTPGVLGALTQPRSPHESLRTALDEELRRLPEQYRTAAVLCYLEGRTQAEA